MIGIGEKKKKLVKKIVMNYRYDCDLISIKIVSCEFRVHISRELKIQNQKNNKFCMSWYLTVPFSILLLVTEKQDKINKMQKNKEENPVNKIKNTKESLNKTKKQKKNINWTDLHASKQTFFSNE